MSATMINPRDIALEHADGLSVAGHYSEKWVLPLFHTAMDIINKGIRTEDTKAMKKVFLQHGVPMTAASESWVNSICMKYHNARSTY